MPGASIIDIGDRIALVEFHIQGQFPEPTKYATCSLLASENKSGRFDALVVGNQGKHFSAGANLSFVLDAARDKKWTILDQTIRTLQATSMTLKYGPLPVIAAPFSNALGGGCEICLHSARVVLADETYMGLVESGIGLIPAGGGYKRTRPSGSIFTLRTKAALDPLSALQKVFEVIVRARVSRTRSGGKRTIPDWNRYRGFLSGKG